MQAVLFNLDGTLLLNDFDELMHEYFRRLAKGFTKWLTPEEFVSHLLSATDKMIASKDPSLTNLEVFEQHFFAESGLDPALMEVFDEFYLTEFPKLKQLSKVDPEAPRVVEKALNAGYKIVIATNPLFPDNAIWERLRWAQVADYPYDLVTTGTNMHFCKPHPEYYQEIADILQLKPEQCLMVGNDPEQDGPASSIGMDLFLVNDGREIANLLPRFSNPSVCD